MSEEFKLTKSKLGTKEYWDHFYQLEHTNFKSNAEDTGECWFDESNAEEKMIEFLVDNFNDKLPTINENSKIIDLGTGNGHLLFELGQHEDGYFANGKLIGIDYSQTSVKFAQQIAKSKELNDKIEFYQVDFLTNYEEFLKDEKFKDLDVLLDKGTLDAIALNSEKYKYKDDEYLGYELYSRIISQLMKKDAVLLITSCNFSEEELTKVVLENSEGLEVWKKINYPSFQFGGVKGSTICSIAFIKQ